MDKFDEREARICGSLPLEDILFFAMFMFDINRGNSGQSYMDKFSEKGYGSKTEEIICKFRSHLNGCYLCNELFNEELDSLEYPLKLNYSSDAEENAKFKRKTELHRWFLLDHSNIPFRNQLLSYLILKFSKTEQNPEFEEHISKCLICTEYAGLIKFFKDRQ